MKHFGLVSHVISYTNDDWNGFNENYKQTWIVGKWITPWEQSWAPSGTHFHQFVVPPILPIRRDCTYGDLAAMRLPHDVEGLGSCEVLPPPNYY